MKITKEKLIEKAKEYDLEVSFNKESGFYIGDKKIDIKELFPELNELEEDEM